MPNITDPAEPEEGKVIQALVMAPLELPKVTVKMEPTEGEPSTPSARYQGSPTASSKVTQMVEDTMLPPCKQVKEEMQQPPEVDGEEAGKQDLFPTSSEHSKETDTEGAMLELG